MRLGASVGLVACTLGMKGVSSTLRSGSYDDTAIDVELPQGDWGFWV